MDTSPAPLHHYETARGDRVSLREKIGLGFGKAVVDGTHGTLHVLVNPIYNMTLGLNPALISTIVFIQRVWDAMLDPFFGQFSDNFRSRWGRRRPLLFLGAFPMAILYVWLWWFPRDAGAGYLFWHLLSVSLFFYAGHSLYSMPLTGLIVEATDDYHERTRIAGITLAFGFAMQVGSQWVFPLTQSKCFSDSISGVRWVSIGCGVLFLVSALIPVVLCRERLYANLASKQPRISFVESWRAACRNKPFMALLWMRSVFSFGANVVGILGAYMYTYYVFGGSIKAAAVGYAVVGSSYHVAAIVTSLAVFPQIECRLGKRCTLQIAAGVLVAGCISKIFLYQPGWTWTPLVAVACNGISNAGVSLMCIAMLGDIADYDEWQSGLRREGLFSSLLSWFDKAGNSLGFLLSGFILTWIGFDARLGAQSDHTLRLMKLIYVAAPATGAVITILLARRYDLNQNLVYDIKAEIARRRAAKGAL